MTSAKALSAKKQFWWRFYPKIDRYIFSITLISSLFALVLLSIIETFITFLAELQDLNEHYTITQILIYLTYDAPARIYRIFPMALLLGSLLGLGQLSSSNELTALRATGLSKLRLMRGAILAILCLSIFSFSIGEILVPATNIKAKETKENQYSLRNGKGFWAISDNKILHVKTVNQSNLNEISIYEIDNSRLKSLIYAKKAILQDRNWYIQDGTESSFLSDKIKKQSFHSLEFPTVIDHTALNALIAGGEGLSLPNLYTFIHYLEANGLDANDYRLVFWNKIFSPLLNLSMLLISLRFIFTHNRKSGVGARLFIGISIGLAIYLLTRMLGHFILLYGYMPILGAIMPTLLAITLGAILLQLERQAN